MQVVCHFSFKKSQIVAPLTKIVALFEKIMWGAFWRFSAPKRALPDSEVLLTLTALVSNCGECILQKRKMLTYLYSEKYVFHHSLETEKVDKSNACALSYR